MLYFHPVLMGVLILLAWYVLRLGWVRFAAVHLGRRAAFNAKRHALLGKLSLGGLLAGSAGGAAMTWLNWSSLGVTGAHGLLALILVPVMVFSFISGLRLDFRSPRLALAHGLANMVLAGLLAVQIWLGVRVLSDFVL